MMKSYRRIARITRARGLNGEVELQSPDGLSVCLAPGLELWVVPPNRDGVRRTQVLEQRGQADRPWVKLAGVEDREAATRLVGHYFLAAEEDCLALAEPQGGEDSGGGGVAGRGGGPVEAGLPAYLEDSVIGLLVYDQEAGFIGRIAEIDRKNPQWLWIVEPESESGAELEHQPEAEPQPGPQPGAEPQPGPQPGAEPQPGPQPQPALLPILIPAVEAYIVRLCPDRLVLRLPAGLLELNR
ncbi:MAG: hypothetical protein FWF30_01975 [Coriobacteriia bacterium]|nr:hypothetical protein [Coriobacteriia bacterium]